MDSSKRSTGPELTALLIAPDRALAEQFLSTLGQSRAFQVLADLKTYPSRNTLEIRLRQIRPDVVLLDAAYDAAAAEEILRWAVQSDTALQVVALSPINNPAALLSCLRLGASEFLYAPFDPQTQIEAVSRLIRLREPLAGQGPQLGTVVTFSSVKPGSGASSLAIQTACALRRMSNKPVLLADFDLCGGTVGWYSRRAEAKSLLEALQNAGQLEPALWSSLVSDLYGVDVLAAPDTPFGGPLDPSRLGAVIEYARMNYGWILLDLPAIFNRTSLMVVSYAERAFLVSTGELASLYLARKAVRLLNHLGFPKDRFQFLINRLNRREDFSRSEIQALVNCDVFSKFPNDYFSLNRVATLGRPLDYGCELGRAIEELSSHLAGTPAPAAGPAAGPRIH